PRDFGLPAQVAGLGGQRAGEDAVGARLDGARLDPLCGWQVLVVVGDRQAWRADPPERAVELGEAVLPVLDGALDRDGTVRGTLDGHAQVADPALVLHVDYLGV